jgi:hypothetical protein
LVLSENLPLGNFDLIMLFCFSHGIMLLEGLMSILHHKLNISIIIYKTKLKLNTLVIQLSYKPGCIVSNGTNTSVSGLTSVDFGVEGDEPSRVVSPDPVTMETGGGWVAIATDG